MAAQGFGYTNLMIFQAGYPAWVEKGYPVKGKGVSATGMPALKK